MSLFGHVVISLSMLQAGLNLSEFGEFMKSCELGLAEDLEEKQRDTAALLRDFLRSSLFYDVQLLCVR